MRLNPKALALTFALLGAGCVLFVAVLNAIWPTYGVAFLNVTSSIYPGFQPGSVGQGVIGALYAALDGAVCGWLLAWIYNAAGGWAARA
jgi:hypothetical protein